MIGRRNRRVLTLAVMAMILVACSSVGQAKQEAAHNRIVYGLTLLPSGFDPQINASSELGIPLRSVYDTLVYRDPTTGEFVPGLAESWAISDDGRTYTFKLRQDVRFHDGTPFNAAAVGANLDRITDPATASQKARFMLGPYQSYQIIDDSTISLTLSEPYSPLLDSLSQVYLGMASPTAFKQYSNNRYQFHQVGTGPFTFVEYVPGNRLVIRRNPDYVWGPAFYKPAVPNSIDEVEFRFYEDEATRSLALENGEAQVMGELPPLDARALTGNNTVQLLPVPIAGQPLQFLLNTQQYPTDNLQIRQALLYGANRNAIVDTVFQRFSPIAWGPLTANTLYYSKAVVGSYAHDTAQAQTLLQQAGYQDTNGDGILDFSGVDLAIKVIVPPWGLLPQVAQLLQDQWKTLGIKVNLVAVPTVGALNDAVKAGDYNLVAFNSYGVDPSFLSQYYATGAANNYSKYSDPQLDDLLNKAVEATDPVARGDLYAQAQAIIMNQALVLPIRDQVNLNGASASIGGLSYDPFGWFPLLNNATLNNG